MCGVYMAWLVVVISGVILTGHVVLSERQCADGQLMKSRLTTAMRAIVVRQFGGEEVMKVETEVAVPTVAANQVLVALESSGVNPVDTYIRGGQYAGLPDLPYTPGKDGAGIVSKVGSAVTKFKTGDRVYLTQSSRWGTLADYTSVQDTNVFHLPASLSFHQGASIGVPYFTAYRALFIKAKAKRGERLLVHGASGAVGLAAVQIAKAHGLSVVGTAGTDAGMKVVGEAGASTVYNHRKAGYLQEMAAGGGFDVILEMLANVNLGNDLPLMNPGGRTIVVGSRGTVTINPRDLMGKEASVMGVALGTSTPTELAEIASGLDEGLKAGWLQPFVDKIYTLDQAAAAHHDIIHSSGAKGKLVVQIKE